MSGRIRPADQRLGAVYRRKDPVSGARVRALGARWERAIRGLACLCAESTPGAAQRDEAVDVIARGSPRAEVARRLPPSFGGRGRNVAVQGTNNSVAWACRPDTQATEATDSARAQPRGCTRPLSVRAHRLRSAAAAPLRPGGLYATAPSLTRGVVSLPDHRHHARSLATLFVGRLRTSPCATSRLFTS